MDEYHPVSAELVLSTVDVPHAASALSARNTDGMITRKKTRLNNLNARHNLPAILFNSPLDFVVSSVERKSDSLKSPLIKGDKGGCLLGAPCPSIGLRAGFTRTTD